MASVRSLRPGEFIQNKNGTQSTERTVTVTHPDVNGGKPTNIPTIYVVDGKILELDLSKPVDDEAAALAVASGQTFPSFKSIKEAVTSAQSRSNKGGAFQGQLGQMLGPIGSRFE